MDDIQSKWNSFSKISFLYADEVVRHSNKELRSFYQCFSFFAFSMMCFCLSLNFIVSALGHLTVEKVWKRTNCWEAEEKLGKWQQHERVIINDKPKNNNTKQ